MIYLIDPQVLANKCKIVCSPNHPQPLYGIVCPEIYL
jgi:hypothetical protein